MIAKLHKGLFAFYTYGSADAPIVLEIPFDPMGHGEEQYRRVLRSSKPETLVADTINVTLRAYYRWAKRKPGPMKQTAFRDLNSWLVALSKVTGSKYTLVVAADEHSGPYLMMVEKEEGITDESFADDLPGMREKLDELYAERHEAPTGMVIKP